MKHTCHSCSRLIAIATAVALLISGCASEQPTAHPKPDETSSEEPQVSHRAGETDHVTKVSAPVDVELTASESSGRVAVRLAFTATAHIPRAVARIVLPEGVDLVGGDLEAEVGEMEVGERRLIEVVVEVPSDKPYQLAGGVDCHLTEGVKLHGGAAVMLGDEWEPPETVVVPNDGKGGVRMGGFR